jgi:hypothetical protein
VREQRLGVARVWEFVGVVDLCARLEGGVKVWMEGVRGVVVPEKCVSVPCVAEEWEALL